ncbi:hypothetical protein ACE1CD_26545 [Aerosakkonema sp. BLCC-F183]|uniref:hypothetical protein n=1 Tax=Aerosakkonema sp. BLCC-F183 TaxID=3342834 RepID=UPI0035B7556E
MNFPPQLKQNIEKWATIQGISPEQFIWEAVAEKIDALNQKSAEKSLDKSSESTNIPPSNQSKIYRKSGILVLDAELPENFDLNTFIDDLREERIQNQMGL